MFIIQVGRIIIIAHDHLFNPTHIIFSTQCKMLKINMDTRHEVMVELAIVHSGDTDGRRNSFSSAALGPSSMWSA